jgi:hypothetical protein
MKQVFEFLAGGPGASLSGGIGACALLAVLDLTRGPGAIAGMAAALYLSLMGFGVMSLLHVVVALVPAAGSGVSSDGAQILRCRKKDTQSEAEAPMLALMGASMSGR